VPASPTPSARRAVVPDTDLTGLNLARRLDGGQLLVGIAPLPGVAADSGAPVAPAETTVNLNTATMEKLDTLPGSAPSPRSTSWTGGPRTVTSPRWTSSAKLTASGGTARETPGPGAGVMPDLRLLPVALAAWVVALTGLHLGWATAAALYRHNRAMRPFWLRVIAVGAVVGVVTAATVIIWRRFDVAVVSGLFTVLAVVGPVTVALTRRVYLALARAPRRADDRSGGKDRSANAEAIHTSLRGDEPRTERREQPDGASETSSVEERPSTASNRARDTAVTLEVPDSSSLVGRTRDLSDLISYCNSGIHRIVALVGLRGIGKTLLAARVAGEYKKEDGTSVFDQVQWHQMINPPPVRRFICNILVLLGGPIMEPDDGSIEHLTQRLLNRLKEQRCLIVIDNAETVLCDLPDAVARVDAMEYRTLFETLGGGRHRSTFFVTSRETPTVLQSLFRRDGPVQLRTLEGVSAIEAQAIFEQVGEFKASDDTWSLLTTRYAGNPLALRCAALQVKEVFFGDILAFLDASGAISEVSELLDWHLSRLDAAEMSLLYWMAIWRTPVTPQELVNSVINVDASLVYSHLHALMGKVPLERHPGRLSLQPVILEHVSARLAEAILDDLLAMRPLLSEEAIETSSEMTINTHPMMCALSPEYIRDMQRRVTLSVTKRRLEAHLEVSEMHSTLLHRILKHWRCHHPLADGYLAANVIHILAHGQAGLTNVDCSYLTVRQCFLRDLTLRNVSFQGAVFRQTVFRQAFASILSVEMIPDLNAVAIGDTSNKIMIWESGNGELLRSLHGHTDWVRALVYWSRQHVLVSTSDDGSVRIWDPSSGECLQIVRGHRNWVWAVAIDDANQRVISGCHGGTVIAGNLDGQTEVLIQVERPILAVACSADGRRVVACVEDGRAVVWSVDHDTYTYSASSVGAPRAVSFSPCGRWLATGGSDNYVYISDARTLRPEHKLEGHEDWVWCLRFSADGAYLISAGNDGVVRFWSTSDWGSRRSIPLKKGWIRDVALDASGDLMMVGSGVGEAQLWRVRDEECVHVWRGYNNAIRHLAVSPSGKRLVGACGDNVVRMWDVLSGRLLTSSNRHQDWVWTVAFSPNGTVIGSGSNDRTVKLWYLDNPPTDPPPSRPSVFVGHGDTVWDITFSPCGDYLASACEDGLVRVWDTISGSLVKSFRCGGWALAVRMTANHRIIVGTSTGSIVVAQLYNEGLEEYPAHNDRVWTLDVLEKEGLMATGGGDGSVGIWDLNAMRLDTLLGQHNGPTRGISVSTDGRFIASGGEDRSICVWDRWTQTTFTLGSHRDWVRSVCFIPGGHQLASGSEDESVGMWDVNERRLLFVIDIPRPYQGTTIRETEGLTPAQRDALMTLGCSEERRSSVHIVDAPGVVSVRMLQIHEWRMLRDLRMGALRDSPDAFEQRLDDISRLSGTDWSRLASEYTQEYSCLLVAEVGERPVGMIYVKADHFWHDAGYIGSMWVAPNARRMGIGSKLLDEGLSLIRRWGLEHARLSVTQQQTQAIALYKREGFIETGIRRPLPSNENRFVIEMSKQTNSI